MIPSLLLALFFVALLTWSLRTLPGLHPVTLWSASWTVATLAYVARLLPYQRLEWDTVGLVAGSSILLALGTRAAERLAPQQLGSSSHGSARTTERIAWSASIGVCLTVGLAIAFVANVADTMGWNSVLRPSIDVENAIAQGTAPRTSAYTYCAIATAGLCALASARGRSRTEARTWLIATTAMIGVLYFSAGRMLMAIAGVSALVVIMLASREGWFRAPRNPSRRWMTVAVGSAAVAVLVVFIAGGHLSGKTLDRVDHVDVGTFSNVFSEHDPLEWAALPYQNVTAALPALDRQFEVTSAWGESHGCALLAFPCRMLGHLGVPLEDEGPLRPFTEPPLKWNTYTFLETPLLDGGVVLAMPIMLVIGLATGVAWVLAGRSVPVGILLYALVACAMMSASRQNLLAQLTLPATVSCLLLLAGYGAERVVVVFKRIRESRSVIAT